MQGAIDDEEDETRADVSGEIRLPATLEGTNGPVPESAEIAIVGGGVIGLAIAYYLAKLGLHDVVVLERGYLAEGASGRNGGGVRQQWSTEINIRLMQESVELCRRFAVDLGVNVWFRQGGYLFLARNAKEVARLEKNIALQNRCGVATRMLEPKAALDIVPELNLDGIVGASYNPSDGILFPWPFLWGYARQAAAYGVRIFTQTPVGGLEPMAGGGYIVHTPRGAVRARRVVNATGAWSPKLAALIGVQVPTWPIRHEICSSEPLKPFLRPMVSELASGLYCSQSMRGEIVPVIDLGVLLGMPRTEVGENSKIVVVEHAAGTAGVIVDRLRDLRTIDQALEPPPNNLPLEVAALLVGVAATSTGTVRVLDAKAVLTAEPLREIAETSDEGRPA